MRAAAVKRYQACRPLTSDAVEYHDPSGLFSLISPEIASRLPLRHLQWQNATRPLRQIKSLHLDFVPDEFTKNSFRPPAQRLDSDGANSFDIVRSGADARKNAGKERRHQIPGFQASPYLKLYILRADDKDAYKATERQKIRNWIRDNAASSKTGKAENHDAFEWLVIHVVIPDTAAASEPRWREASTKDSDELALRERKQGMKLPGKSTRTTFDKLRADFNESGKGSIDRVAQIRLTRAQMSPDLLPTPALATTIEETNEERATAWNDLLGKFKTLILGPFDLRVRQYESDVAEQEKRRVMPGFNFCTFFIHKEGLAKALESIGLVEDSLVIYDELSLGLESVVRDLARGQAEGTATILAPYTTDFADRILGLKSSRVNGTGSQDAVTQSSTGKDYLEVDYREKIVRSDISVFDFFSYLFARQKALILRIANAKSATSFTKDGVENILLISEVCWRAMSFVHNNARTLRHDLSALRESQWEKQASNTLSSADIESLVCSWTFTVAGRILDETESSSVDSFSDLSKRDSMTNGTTHGQARSDTHLPGGVSAHPHRMSSLPKKSRIGELQNGMSFQSASESDLLSPRSSTNDDYLKPGALTPGLLELVTYRAELLMMQRRMLEILAKQRGWEAGWATLNDQKSSMVEIDLNGDVENSAKHVKNNEAATASTSTTPALASLLSSKENFHKAYVWLSEKAMRLFVAATQTKTAESIMGDLAILKSQQGDYEYAISYFQHVLPLYTAEGWSLMEDKALKMHADCLKQLDRGEEYVTVLLTLLAKVCGRLKTSECSSSRIQSIGESIDSGGILPELVEYSRSLKGDITNPADQFFSDLQLEREVMHFDDKDGFALRLRFRHLLDDEVKLDKLSVRLVHADEPGMDIWLTNNEPSDLQRGINTFTLEAPEVASGPYLIDGLAIEAGKLCFVHEFTSKSAPLEDPEEKTSSSLGYKQPWVFLYPQPQAFDAEIWLSKDIHMDKTRYLEIEMKSGWNDIAAIEIRLKPASAGLRLHLADALLKNIDPTLDEQPGQISLAAMEPNSSAIVKVPYTLEQTTVDIVTRFELEFKTSQGIFSMSKIVKLVTQLPIDVDVNDMFHLDFLLSNFLLRSTSGAPLNIMQAELTSSSAYNVEAPSTLPKPTTIFDKHPVNLVYRITRSPSTQPPNAKSAALALNVRYYSVDELILNIAQERLAAALISSDFEHLSGLLLPVLYDRLRSLYSRSDVELAILLDEAKIPSFGDLGWMEIINTLPATTTPDLVSWLSAWHKENGCIRLDQDAAASTRVTRSLTISVDVPRVDYVHEVSLLLPSQRQTTSHDPQVLVVGDPIEAQINVASTQIWSNTAVFHPERTQDLENAHDEFMLDINTDSDHWLIGGQRRVHFMPTANTMSIFNVLLIPLNLGLQPLPNIGIQPAKTQHMSEESHKQNERAPTTCETHVASAGLLVHVFRGLRTSRVSISESASTGRPPSRPSTAATAKEAG